MMFAIQGQCFSTDYPRDQRLQWMTARPWPAIPRGLGAMTALPGGEVQQTTRARRPSRSPQRRHKPTCTLQVRQPLGVASRGQAANLPVRRAPAELSAGNLQPFAKHHAVSAIVPTATSGGRRGEIRAGVPAQITGRIPRAPLDLWLGYTQRSFWQVSNREAQAHLQKPTDLALILPDTF